MMQKILKALGNRPYLVVIVAAMAWTLWWVIISAPPETHSGARPLMTTQEAERARTVLRLAEMWVAAAEQSNTVTVDWTNGGSKQAYAAFNATRDLRQERLFMVITGRTWLQLSGTCLVRLTDSEWEQLTNHYASGLVTNPILFYASKTNQ